MLASAFETTTADLQTLLTELDGEFEKVKKIIIFNLNNLSHLYRYSLLAGSMGVTVKELLALVKITGIRPLPKITEAVDANTNTIDRYAKKTWQFLEATDKIKASGFEIAELEYLLCDRPGDKAGFHPSKEEVGIVLGDIRTNLRKIADEKSVARGICGGSESRITVTHRPGFVQIAAFGLGWRYDKSYYRSA
ncbi:MAG: hypothetical protein IPG32_07555 [Saprospirales bacterium]|nr:hypothetical protein [Saprospirales bacterium]